MSFVGCAWAGVFAMVASVRSLITRFIHILGPWSEHGTAWYSCNRYDEKESVEARDAQSKSRASLERYLHVGIF